MEKHVYDEKNGLSYTLCGDCYLPDLVLNEEEPTYGKYGMLRKQFLKEYRPIRYNLFFPYCHSMFWKQHTKDCINFTMRSF